MLFFRLKNKRASAIVEISCLIMVFIAAGFIASKYVMRSMSGRWKSVGDSFGFGRQYSAKNTLECAIYMTNSAGTDFWYMTDCAYNNNCDLTNQTCYSSCQDARCIPP